MNEERLQTDRLILRKLTIDIDATNYNVLTSLNALTELELEHGIYNAEDYNAITQIPNLQKIEFSNHIETNEKNTTYLKASILSLHDPAFPNKSGAKANQSV